MTTSARTATLRTLAAVGRRLSFAGLAPGLMAILVKELRSRMRGRRAFVTITVQLLLVGGVTWMIQRIAEQQALMWGAFGGPSGFIGASIGRFIFYGLIGLQTLIVAVLAPASTAGTISGERERQTLELLAVTPISSAAIVLGKMVSALTWVLVLVLSSIPITSLVFLYGGVAPDDVIRGYLVILMTAVGFGSIGIFFSALVRRSGAATGLTFVAVLVTVVGSVFLWVFLYATNRDPTTNIPRRPPAAVLYLNPFVAQADVACGVEGSAGSWCSVISGIVEPEPTPGPVPQAVPEPGIGPAPVPLVPKDMPAPAVQGGVGVTRAILTSEVVRVAPVDGPISPEASGAAVLADTAAPPGVQPDQPVVVNFRDRFWPYTVTVWLIVSAILLTAAVQLVTPTRRWRPHLPRRPRRAPRAEPGGGDAS